LSDSLHSRLGSTLLCKHVLSVLNILALACLPVALSAELVAGIDSSVFGGVQMPMLAVGVEGYCAPCVFSPRDRLQMRRVNTKRNPTQVVKFDPGWYWSNENMPCKPVCKHEPLWGIPTRPSSTIPGLVDEACPDPAPSVGLVQLLHVVPEQLLQGLYGPPCAVGGVAVLVAVNGISSNGGELLQAFGAGLLKRHSSLQYSPEVQGEAGAGGHPTFGVAHEAAPIPLWTVARSGGGGNALVWGECISSLSAPDRGGKGALDAPEGGSSNGNHSGL